MKIRLEIDRTSWLWRPIGKLSRAMVLAVSMLLIASVAFAGWLNITGTFTGTVGTAQGLSGVFIGTGACSVTTPPGTAAFVSASGLNVNFVASGLTPSSVVHCEALFKNTGPGIIRGSTAASSQTWATITGLDTSNWSANEEKMQKIDIHFADTMPESGVALPLVITVTWVPGT